MRSDVAAAAGKGGGSSLAGPRDVGRNVIGTARLEQLRDAGREAVRQSWRDHVAPKIMSRPRHFGYELLNELSSYGGSILHGQQQAGLYDKLRNAGKCARSPSSSIRIAGIKAPQL